MLERAREREREGREERRTKFIMPAVSGSVPEVFTLIAYIFTLPINEICFHFK